MKKNTSQTKNHDSRNTGETKKNRIRGLIKLTTRGKGFVVTEQFEQDIEIPNENLNTALNGDTVEIALLPKQPNQRQQGEVIEIIQRSKLRFVGGVEESEGAFYLSADDTRMYRDIIIRKKDEGLVSVGDKAHVEITKWTDPQKNPEGRVLRVLGREGEHNVEMEAIVLEKGFDVDFPDDVAAEAQKIAQENSPIPENEKQKRRDLRDVPTCTIDPEDAKDFDDALSLRMNDDGTYEVGVHIADVSHYVTEGSALDTEARERGFSVYLVDRTIPMLPLELSTDICSLNPEEDRLAFSAIFTITESGDVTDRWFGKTVIHSDKRFAYEEAQRVIDAGSGPLSDELTTLNKLAHELRRKKFKNGAIDFETEEVEFELADDGTPIKVYKKPRLDVHKLIEDFMLLANREVAKHMYDAHHEKKKETRAGARPDGEEKGQKDKGGGFIYRIHELPDPDKLAELSVYMKALGYEETHLEHEDVTSKDLNKLLQQVSGTPEEALIKTAAIRAMSKAVYSTKNIGHFGLAFQYYTHFTSPIRRYPDLVVHRLLHRHLEGDHVSPKEYSRYQKIAADASEKEIRAAEAERDSIKYKQVEYMNEHVGETFDAVISGVVDYGLYVQEVHTHAEGLVHVSNIGDDFFELEEKGYALVGKDSGTRYTLGDEVKVKLTDVDLDKKQLSFEITGTQKDENAET